MPIDEVNEKFPMMKYKSWVASRAQEGLPTRGGISQPPSRANSLRDADGIIPVIKERESTDERPATSGGASITRPKTNEEKPTAEQEKKAETPTETNGETAPTDDAAAHTVALDRTESPSSDEDPDEDDQIHDALPPEMLESSGDTCAICIDTLEDDDDVRGLTCGHAFHAVCLDPWLTSRRACCPLCKADYYTPKPRPPQAEGAAPGVEVGPTVSINQDPRSNRMNMPSRPGVAWMFSRRGASRLALPSLNRDRNAVSNQAQASPRSTNNATRPQRSRFMSRTTATTQAARSSRPVTNRPEETQSQPGGFLQNIRLPRFGRSAAAESGSEVSPSNLEAGVRTDAAR